jgi:hypothetical protein
METKLKIRNYFYFCSLVFLIIFWGKKVVFNVEAGDMFTRSLTVLKG